MFLGCQQLQLLASIREVGGRALTERRWFPLVAHLSSAPLEIQGKYQLEGKLFTSLNPGEARCLNILELNM